MGISNKYTCSVNEANPGLSAYLNVGEAHNGSSKGRPCFFCGDDAVSLEHIIQKSHGGNNTDHNVKPVCKTHEVPPNVPYTEHYSEDEVEKIHKDWNYDKEVAKNPYSPELRYAYGIVLRRFIARSHNEFKAFTQLEMLPELSGEFKITGRWKCDVDEAYRLAELIEKGEYNG